MHDMCVDRHGARLCAHHAHDDDTATLKRCDCLQRGIPAY